MDSISFATILAATAVIGEEWRQADYRGRPRVDYRLDVLWRRRFMRRRRALLYASPWSPWRVVDPSDMGQALGEVLGQAEDPRELPIFLTQEESNYRVHGLQLRVRPIPVSGDTCTTFVDVMMELSNVRHNMVSYEARYPAAVEVRNNLGDEIWERLEEYRCGVACLAFSTLREQRTGSIDFSVGFEAFLDQFIPHMQTYVTAAWGAADEDLFEFYHDGLEGEIVYDRDHEGIEAQEGWPMQLMKLLFRRQPIFWLAYNLYFPVDGRMSLEQVLTWAIQWLRRTSLEPPAWPIQLRGLYVWNPDTTPIWNRAVLELFADIRRRFGSTHTLHEAV